MRETETVAAERADRRVMVLHRNGVPDMTMVHVITPDQTVAFISRFPVDSGCEWVPVMGSDLTDIDFTRGWGE